MSHQTATSVVALPMAQVEERLRDVDTWPLFLPGLAEVAKVGHQRYRMTVRSARTLREVLATVQHHPREHRFSWKNLEGPTYAGEIRLHPEGEHRTRIKLEFTSDPVGFMAGIGELFGSRNDTAEIELRKLEAHLSPEQ